MVVVGSLLGIASRPIGAAAAPPAPPAAPAPPAGASGQRQVDSMGRDYFLYTPARVDPARTYWLVVGVHGYGGSGEGAAGLADWVRRGDCLVVGPSFPNEGYQLLHQEAGEQLKKLFVDLGKKYKLHPRMFLYGFSGGAQFAHRFMLKYPELVAGCAAHSGGSWATGGPWGEVNAAAKDVPLVISCGRNDTGKMHPSAPYSRLDWCKAFEKVLDEQGFVYQAEYWADLGHQYGPGARKITEECYVVATTVLPRARQAAEGIAKQVEAGEYAAALKAIGTARLPASRASTPLVRKAAVRVNERLDELLAKVEEAGLERVKGIAEAPADRAGAAGQLRKVLVEFRGAPKTTAAAQEAIKRLTAPAGR